MKDDTTFFEQLAQNLVDADTGGELPKRYLALRRRRAALKVLVTEARNAAKWKNSLAKIHLRPPLSVAGEPSLVIVRAEGLRAAGVPICTEFDEKGRHRGTPLHEVLDLLKARTGRRWSVTEVLEEYQRLVNWHPNVIHNHPTARYRKIPRLKRMLRQEREALELRMREYIRSRDTRIFSVAADEASLRMAVNQCPGPSVTLGFNGTGSELFIDSKHPVLVAWGYGCGLAVLALQDLRGLVGRSGALVVLDLDLEGWDAWTDSAVEVARTIVGGEISETKRFEYFGPAVALPV